ncbi:hypothetical protein V6N12_076423 [Hibiscus sabdariffa]|uniref:Uncharacterized protein n=1 Tax=Hibiscus sabdariffa TaxID=183260 RepID=A0ABR2DCP8_9ROSI
MGGRKRLWDGGPDTSTMGVDWVFLDLWVLAIFLSKDYGYFDSLMMLLGGEMQMVKEKSDATSIRKSKAMYVCRFKFEQAES